MPNKIEFSESSRMLWIDNEDGFLSVSGGGRDAANVLVSKASGSTSIDIVPNEIEALIRCLATYVGREVVIVERQALDDLTSAASAAEQVLAVLDLGKPLRLALERLTKRANDREKE